MIVLYRQVCKHIHLNNNKYYLNLGYDVKIGDSIEVYYKKIQRIWDCCKIKFEKSFNF